MAQVGLKEKGIMSTSDPFFDEEDLNNPSFRCKHGTFIGNPYGADYLCGPCEMGDDDEPEEEEDQDALAEPFGPVVYPELQMSQFCPTPVGEGMCGRPFVSSFVVGAPGYGGGFVCEGGHEVYRSWGILTLDQA